MLKIKLLVLIMFAAGTAALLLFTDNAANPRAGAFSAGPPAGFTRAPGELDCSDCHTTPAGGSGTLKLDAPQGYTPGQTYDITVTHATSDLTRVRWGFELTALDSSDQKAGRLAPSDDSTQVVNGQGPFPAREYIEHTAKGSFPAQQNGASWTFKWTAPDDDVGAVTFYVAGNQANGDGNSSGDNIYFTFVSAGFQPPSPDFQLAVSPTTRTSTKGAAAVTYDVTVTPTNGFIGSVSLGVAGLPAGATSDVQPPSLNFADATPRTATLGVNTSASTPTGEYTLDVIGATGASSSLTRAAHAALKVLAATDADLSITQTVSPNPAQVNDDIKLTFTVTNRGPAQAVSPHVFEVLPSTLTSFTKGAGGQMCSVGPATGSVVYECTLPTLAAGQSMTFDFTVRTAMAGVMNARAVIVLPSDTNDPFTSDNAAVSAVPVNAQASGPSMTVTNLGVRTIVSGLDQPTGMAFVGANDFLILEKATGRVLRVKNGIVAGVALDLAVNSASERGLLGIALHPSFAANGFVYLYWTESSTGADATDINAVPLLANRVDRFKWDGARLDFDRTLIRLRARQEDAGQPPRGNHNGGVLRFGPDGKLYVLMGDNGRRGFLQNLPCGPTPDCTGPVTADDQFGGPEPDDAHFTGVILRLNDDGTTPDDNPFAGIPSTQVTQASLNVKKIFAYGIRNGFGMDFDPQGGSLWTQENGDDAFDEINRVEAGFNGGWVQMMGPSSRVAEFKAIEVARGDSLQQNRWPPSNTADTPAQALSRLFVLPGSHYAEPEFSWKYAVAPSPIGFARGAGLGAQYAGDLFVGASRTTLLGGYLMRLKLSADRKSVAATDARLADKVADNSDKFDVTESESLVVGRDFGITTDIETAPATGTLYVVSLSNGSVYEVYSKPTLFVANLDGSQETPPHEVSARGVATLLLDSDETTARVSLDFRALSSDQTAAHVHEPAGPGQTAPPAFDLPSGNFKDFQVTLAPQQVADLKAGLFYVNVHSADLPAGEIRGQFGAVSQPSAAQFDVPDPTLREGSSTQSKTIRVVRLGDTSEAATVDYATSDGTATERSDYTTARGTLRFAAGETEKTFDVSVNDDAFQEPDETFNLTLSNATGPLVPASPSTLVFTIRDDDAAPAPGNPADDSQFFVRQHYRDFLNREPDASGLAFWTNEIESCGANQQCRDVKRVNVSAAFFLSIEFQETGFLVHRLYEASFDREPRYAEFIADTQEIARGVVVGQGDWQARLAANRQSFVDAWVERAAFEAAFNSLSNAAYVDRLYSNAGVTPTTAERDALVAALDSNAKTRARVLLEVAEGAAFRRQVFNRAFVLMEYFGYLRRNPEDPPDFFRDGYDFWLSKLNAFGGDFQRAEMVKAFISSDEYRQRFGP
jgi:aldose sugar dehydrogenase